MTSTQREIEVSYDISNEFFRLWLDDRMHYTSASYLTGRETLEEAGVVCGKVTYMASQPWPFPMSLMIVCHAQAVSTDITVDRTELEDARWFTREEVAQMLTGQHPEGITLPPPVAIAHHIIRTWIEEGDGVFR